MGLAWLVVAASACGKTAQLALLEAEETASVLGRFNVARVLATESELTRFLIEEQKLDPTIARQVVRGFGGRAQLVTNEEPVLLKRLFGGQAKATGRWLSDSVADGRRALALPPQNLADRFAVASIPRGTRFLVGEAAPLFGEAGGGRQFLALDRPGFAPVETWIKEQSPAYKDVLEAATRKGAEQTGNRKLLVGLALGSAAARRLPMGPS